MSKGCDGAEMFEDAGVEGLVDIGLVTARGGDAHVRVRGGAAGSGEGFGMQGEFVAGSGGECAHDVAGVQEGVDGLDGWVGRKDELELAGCGLGVELFEVDAHGVESLNHVTQEFGDLGVGEVARHGPGVTVGRQGVETT